MLRPRLLLAALAVLIALAALATLAAAQTPPPATGDWVVTDWTSLRDVQVHVDGDVIVRHPGWLKFDNASLDCRNVTVESGRLELFHTALVLNGTGPQRITVRPGGYLTVVRGSLGSTHGNATLYFEAWGYMNGTAISGFNTIHVASFMCSVRNCTITEPTGNGVTISPGLGPWPWGLIDIADNVIVRPALAGVTAFIRSDPGEHWQLNVVGNRVVDAGTDGIYIATGHMQRAQVIVRDNIVEGARDRGVLISLSADSIELDADGNHVEGAGEDGVRISLDTPDLSHLAVDDITSVGNGGHGIVLLSQYRTLADVELRGWDASDNALGGVHLEGIMGATLWGSRVLNTAPGAVDYTLAGMSTLTIHGGEHGKASAQAVGAIASVTSVRRLAMRFAWGDGTACSGRYIEVRDDTGAVVLSGIADADGRLANVTVWEWNVVEGASSVRSALRPLLMGEVTFLEGPTLVFDRDIDGTVTFVDDVPPVLEVTRPVNGVEQSATTITVEGTCWDDHTGVSELLVGLAVGAGAEPATWTPVGFELRWQTSFEGLADGTYAVWVRVLDNGDGATTIVRTVVVDTRPPWLEVSGPSDGGLVNMSLVAVRGTVEAGATVSVGGRVALVQDGAFDAEALLVEGTNTILVVARDRAGNVLRRELTVTLDTVPPYLWVDAVVDGRVSSHPGRLTLVGLVEPGASLTAHIGGEGRPVDVRKDGAFEVTLELREGGLDVAFDAMDDAGNHNVQPVRIDAVAVDDGPVMVAPLVIGVAATACMLAVLGAVATTETGKYSLLLALMPLYAKIKRDEVLDNRVRYLLHGHIIDNPGMHFNALLREFELSTGLATYHLDVLEREGFIRSVRDGTLRRFYAMDVKAPDRRLTPAELAVVIKELIVQRPGVSQKELIEELGLSRRAVGYHLQELVRAGEISAAQRGRNTIYRPRRTHGAFGGPNGKNQASRARGQTDVAYAEPSRDREA